MIDINSQMITDLIKEHETTLIPRYTKLQDIYEGKHDILNRITTEDKPNNKLIIDMQGYITKIMTGYFMGEKVLYNSINSDTEKDEELLYILQSLYKRTNEQKHNTELATELSVKGEAFEILYINDDKEVDLVHIPAEEIIVQYESSFKKKLDVALRHYKVKDITNDKIIRKVEVYTKDKIQYFTEIDKNKYILDKEVNHYFNEVPVIHYMNNKEKRGDWESTLSLINELENRLSDNANELQAFRESYLLLKGLDIDPKDLKAFRESGAISTADSKSDISFLTKDINDTFTENHINRLIDLIHTISMVPDMSDDKFGGNLSGVSIKFKLYTMETVTASKEVYFRQALMQRCKLISNYINYTEVKDYDYNDIECIFTRNVPANMSEVIENSSNLSGLVSQETAISQLPFVTDVKEEMDRINQEMNPYGEDLSFNSYDSEG